MPVHNTTNPDDIYLNEQEEIQQILGSPPGWLTQWGIGIIGFVFFLVLSLSWFIHYPQTVRATVRLTTENPPVGALAKSSGRLDTLFFTDKQIVQAEEVGAVLENPAQWQDVLDLEAFLENMGNWQKTTNLELPDGLVLGELQDSYSTFVQDWNNYVFYKRQNKLEESELQIQNQIQNLEQINASIEERRQLFAQELEHSKKIYDRNAKLFEQGTLSKEDFDEKSMAYLQQQRQFKMLESEILNNKLQINQLNARIVELSQNNAQDINAQELKLREDIKQLKTDIATWKQRYLITAPVAGQVIMTTPWNTNQAVNPEDELFTVVPQQGTAEIIGRMALPIFGAGKVKPEQNVKIYLEEFPYQEFGILNGKVEDIALLSRENTYLVKIRLEQGMLSSAHQLLPFKPDMQGTADIIVDNKRISDYFFQNIIALVRDKF